MEIVTKQPHRNDSFNFKRPRLNSLFKKAAKYPFVVICAGAGYGKTSAVHDFVEEHKVKTLWTQLSESDNNCARYWETTIRTLKQINIPFANAASKLGFPDTK